MRNENIDNGLVRKIAGASATRFDVKYAEAKVEKHLRNAYIEQWAQVRRIDTDEGDTMNTSTLAPIRDDSRDSTCVRVRHRSQLSFCFDSDQCVSAVRIFS